MQERARNIAVGVTALAGVVGLMFMMLMFGYVPRLLEGGYLVTVHIPTAAGISTDARVYLNGIDVGRVESVMLREPASAGVVMMVRIQDDIILPQGVRAVVDMQMLSGTARLDLDVSALPSDAPRLATDGSAVIQGALRDLSEKLFGNIGDALLGPTEQFDRLTTSFEQLSQQWVQVGQNINQLIEPRTTDQVDQGELPGNLATVLARMDQRLADLAEIMDGISQWTSDEQFRSDVRAAAAGTASVVTKLDKSLDDLIQSHVALADDLSRAINTMQVAIEQAQQGEGTLGKLLNDPALYDNLEDAAERIGLMVDEMKLLIEKWKAEGVPIQY